MGRYRQQLPQLEGDLYLADGGIETTLVFHEGIPLPWCAAFDLLRSAEGTEVLRGYFERYARLARGHGLGAPQPRRARRESRSRRR